MIIPTIHLNGTQSVLAELEQLAEEIDNAYSSRPSGGGMMAPSKFGGMSMAEMLATVESLRSEIQAVELRIRDVLHERDAPQDVEPSDGPFAEARQVQREVDELLHQYEAPRSQHHSRRAEQAPRSSSWMKMMLMMLAEMA